MHSCAMRLGFLNPGSSHPSAGNKQSVHIVSFSAGRTRSRPAGHATIYSLFELSYTGKTSRISFYRDYCSKSIEQFTVQAVAVY